ncbi:hypothetical protein [Parashewanella tropica]|uniref:hypothetical protein n=1 Tax=Parashewanella tropica TaxID=2547970 RepID=UPI001059BE0C|nr:hypothetical protein [Parashewanella tropica]
MKILILLVALAGSVQAESNPDAPRLIIDKTQRYAHLGQTIQINCNEHGKSFIPDYIINGKNYILPSLPYGFAQTATGIQYTVQKAPDYLQIQCFVNYFDTKAGRVGVSISNSLEIMVLPTGD